MKANGEKTVLVTGASSGIGHATALRLVANGFGVFAAVRKTSDGDALKVVGRGRIVPVQIDVTDATTIAAALALVRAGVGDRGLDGLVNNAGIGTPAPIEYMSSEVMRRQFEVNVFGQVAVTQAFLPLIRMARGRIVNIGSVGSHLAMPFGGALCGSKAAFSLISDALRLELRPDGIHVVLIEPGAIHTPAVDKTLGDVEAIVGALPPEGKARYGDRLRKFMRLGHERETSGSPPELVAEAIHHALTAPRPRLRYAVGAHARGLSALPRFLPDRLLDQVRLRMLKMSTAFGATSAGGHV